MGLILGKKNKQNSVGKILTNRWWQNVTAGSVLCFNIGTLSTDCVFPHLSQIPPRVSRSEILGGESVKQWAEIIKEK